MEIVNEMKLRAIVVIAKVRKDYWLPLHKKGNILDLNHPSQEGEHMTYFILVFTQFFILNPISHLIENLTFTHSKIKNYILFFLKKKY